MIQPITKKAKRSVTGKKRQKKAKKNGAGASNKEVELLTLNKGLLEIEREKLDISKKSLEQQVQIAKSLKEIAASLNRIPQPNSSSPKTAVDILNSITSEQ